MQLSDHKLPINQDTLMSLPYWWYDAFFGFVALFGLLFWLFGKTLVRQALTFAGLMIGGLTAFSVAHLNVPEWNPLFLVIPGALAGAIASFILYRFAMAGILALALGLICPWAAAMWYEMPVPQVVSHIQRIGADVQQTVDEQVRMHTANQKMDPWPAMEKALGDGVKSIKAGVANWWEELKPDNQVTLTIVTLGGLIAGVVGGLLMPNTAAIVVSTWIGVVMLSAAVTRVAAAHWPGLAEYLPGTPRGVLLSLVGATAFGAIVQWRIFRRKAD